MPKKIKNEEIEFDSIVYWKSFIRPMVAIIGGYVVSAGFHWDEHIGAAVGLILERAVALGMFYWKKRKSQK